MTPPPSPVSTTAAGPAGTVQELQELHGADAERICLRGAEHSEKDGMPAMAKDWRELAAEVVRLADPAPSSQRILVRSINLAAKYP
jgi:hypothetical protein